MPCPRTLATTIILIGSAALVACSAGDSFPDAALDGSDANVFERVVSTGNVYAETTESGSAVANFAGLGGTGTIAPSTLESSNVDLSTEFANMIITQRSFSANARTITTADSELQEVVNLVR